MRLARIFQLRARCHRGRSSITGGSDPKVDAQTRLLGTTTGSAPIAASCRFVSHIEGIASRRGPLARQETMMAEPAS